MANNTERLSPGLALFGMVLLNIVAWSVVYAVIQAGLAIFRLARAVLP